MKSFTNTVMNLFFRVQIHRFLLPLLLVLLLTGMEATSQSTVVKVRFANPVYSCTTQGYCLDVEFQSDVPEQVLFGMNVRFMYDDAVLEFVKLADFQGGYKEISDPATPPVTGSPGSGSLWGFTGPMEFINRIIEYDPTSFIPISTTGWTKLFSVCFHIDDMNAFTEAGFCPSVVWDLELDPTLGGFLQGDNGVVISVVKPGAPTESLPVLEQVVQFNWAYDGTVEPPYGAPVPTVCVQGDQVPPVITTEAVSHDLGCNPGAISAPLFSATDNCDPMVTPTVTVDGPVNSGCIWSQTWTANAMDAAGNAAAPVSITYTWTVDEVPPLLTVPEANLDLGCNPAMPTVDDVIAASLATDNCSTPTITAVAGQVTGTCVKSLTFTVTATDGCLNTDVKQVTYTWTEDEIPPVLTVPTTGLALGCNPALPTEADVIAASSATDNCSTPVITAVAGEVTGTCVKTQTFTVTATDMCGNKDVKTVIYTWTDDKVLPVLTVPVTGLDLGCNPVLPTVADVVAASSATDDCSTPVVSATAGDITGTCIKSLTFTVKATDACGNEDVETVTYTWKDDKVLPVITGCPEGPIDLGLMPANLPDCADALALVSATDDCSGALTPTCSAGNVIANGCQRTQSFTITAVDGCGNQAGCVVTYTWVTGMPEFVCPSAPINLECNPVEPVCADAIAAVPVSDGCGGVLVPSCAAGPVIEEGCLRSKAFTLTATSNTGLTATCVVTFTWTADRVLPVVSTSAVNSDLGCNPTVIAPLFTATDNCAGPLVPEVTSAGPTHDGCLYSQTWTANATDNCGNQAIPVSITYTWKQDNDIPLITTLNQDTDLGCNPDMIVIPQFTATDNCDGILNPVVTTSGSQQNGCMFMQTWTANVSDACGNQALPVSITYTWTADMVLPVITTTAQSGNLGCNPTVVPPSFSATDNCSGVLTPAVTTSGPTPQPGCIWSQTWTANATDGCGNQAVPVSITYTWTQDSGLPLITTGAVSKDLGCNPVVISPVFTLSDNCSGATVPVVTTSGPVGEGCSWSQTWTATFMDGCQNVAVPVSITYTWKQDVVLPEFVVPADLTIEAGENCQYDASPEKTGWITNLTDNCTLSPVVEYSDVETPGIDGLRIITRTWKATDECGNKATEVQTITVVGGVAPPELVLHDHCVYLTEYGKWTLNRWDKEQITAGSKGGCGTLTKLTFTFEPQSFNCNQADQHIPVVVTAKDELGNTASGTVNVLVRDTISPVAVCKDITVTLDSYNQAFILPGMIDNGSYDNCSVSKLALDKQLFTQFDEGKVVQVMLVAFDPSGNTGTCQANVTVRPKVTVVVAVNQAPTIADVAEVKIINEPLSLDIPLTNITPGSDQSQKVIAVTAVCDNPGLVTNLEVIYNPGDANGKLKVIVAPSKSGSTIITLTVKDDGGTENGGVDTTVKTFRISVENTGSSINVTVVDGTGNAAVTSSVLNVGEEFMAKLWPNPTSGKVNIDLNWSDVKDVNVSVYNVLGVMVYSNHFNSGDLIQLDLSGRATGVYMVKINAEGKTLVKKVTLDRR